MKIRIENWNGHKIRFVEKEPGDWWAVIKDITDALALLTKRVKERLPKEVVSTDHISDSLGRLQEMLIVNEYGIYETVFESRKKEAKEFKHWVFRMLDKEHQREAMHRLNTGLAQPGRVDFIKANTIANETVSSMFGYPKMLKKGAMTPDMLVQRQPILDDTVELMAIREKFGLDLAVNETVYKKYQPVN